MAMLLLKLGARQLGVGSNSKLGILKVAPVGNKYHSASKVW